MSYAATSAPEGDAEAVARRAITISTILFCAGLVADIVRWQVFAGLLYSGGLDSAALTFNLVWGIVFDLAFVAVVYLRAITPSRRVPATAAAVGVLLCDSGPVALSQVSQWVGATSPWPPESIVSVTAWAVPFLMVLAWGLSRRRNPLWTFGLMPALILIGVAYFVTRSDSFAPGFGLIGTLSWALAWWGAVGLGCLACWGIDVFGGASARGAVPSQPVLDPGYPAPPVAHPGMPSPPNPVPGAAMPTNSMAIAALVSALVFAPLGIVFGHISLSQIKRTGENGRGLAIAGLVIGYVGVAIGLLCLAVVIITIISIDSTGWH